MNFQHFRDLIAHVEHRVQGRCRLLKDHRDAIAANLRHLAGAQLQEIAALKQNLTAIDFARRADQPQDRKGGHALAAARFADQPQDFATMHFKAHAIHGFHHAVVRVEAGVQVANLQQDFALIGDELGSVSQVS